MAANPAEIVARHDRMKAERAITDGHLEEVRKLIFPDGTPFNMREAPGTKAYQDVLDSTGVQACETFAAGMENLLTNASVRWLEVRAVDDALNQDEECAAWLEHATDTMYAIFNSPASSFTTSQHEKYTEIGAFGSAFQFIEDRPGNVPLFRTYPLNACHFAESHEGRVDTVYLDLEFTARQALQKWGEKAGEKVVKAAQDPKKADECFRFVRAIYPRADRDPQRYTTTNLPWADCVVNVAEKVLVQEKGFHEFPGAAPRWPNKRAGEIYGRGPGMKALGDAKILQRAMKATIRGLEKSVNPALMVADDGVVGPVRTTDNGITYVRADMMRGGIEPVKPMVTGARPDLGEDYMVGVRGRIDKAFYVDLFRFARDPNMTATQYLGILEQVRMVLQPILGRMHAEDLNAVVIRVFGICMRAGLFRPVPRRLVGAPFRVNYISPVAKSAKIGEARAVSQSVEILPPLINAKPELMDNFDDDKIVREVSVDVGMRASWLRPIAQRDAMRQARQQVAEQKAQQDAALNAAEIAKKGGNAIKSFAQAGNELPAGGQPEPQPAEAA